MKKTVLCKILVTLFIIYTGGCMRPGEKKTVPFVQEVRHPEWSENAVIYEINVRQFSPGGTLSAVHPHLPRLKELGVDVLWLMPVYPLGEENIKGPLGSHYCIRDFKAVNPAYGTLDDVRAFIDEAHSMGFRVIFDWVPNHTSWDNVLTLEHPEWFAKDSLGNFTSPYGTDWTDVIQLDWTQTGLQEYMLGALKFWVEMGVDGFRVDQPQNTPVEFWERARIELEKIRPVLMLAENEDITAFLEKGFDMNYSWVLFHLMNSIARGEESAGKLREYFEAEKIKFPPEVYRLRFVSNHDENTHRGPVVKRLNVAHKAFASLIFTIPGLPMIYNGQEACLDKALKEFEADPIEWKECEYTGFYRELIRIRKENQALRSGTPGGEMTILETGKGNQVFAFSREKEGNRIIHILNLGAAPVKVKPSVPGATGPFMDPFDGRTVMFPLTDSLHLGPWDFLLLTR